MEHHVVTIRDLILISRLVRGTNFLMSIPPGIMSDLEETLRVLRPFRSDGIP